MPPTKTEAPLDEKLREHLRDFETFFEAIGFKQRQGRVWGMLVLAGRPLSLGEVAEQLGISIGSASEALTELREWGAITSEFSPTHRAQLHSPVSDTLSIVATVLRRREQVAIERFKESARHALAHLQRGDERDPRIETLQSIVTTSDIAQGAIQFFVTTANGTSMDADTRLSRLMRRMMGLGAKLSNEAIKFIGKNDGGRA
ncbi:MAG: hypothetical protein KBG84_04280 [Planctomycetes bacterium]|nr:hypothetical protein [Planctomycetota bacterium]CAG1011800.1 hypothetical protein BURK2_04364 [Burkholderiales bacterium]